MIQRRSAQVGLAQVGIRQIRLGEIELGKVQPGQPGVAQHGLPPVRAVGVQVRLVPRRDPVQLALPGGPPLALSRPPVEDRVPALVEVPRRRRARLGQVRHYR